MKKLAIVTLAAFAGTAAWAAYGPYDDELPCGTSEADSFTKAKGYVKHTVGDSASGSVYIYSFTTNDVKKTIDKCGTWDEEAAVPHAGAKYYAANTVVTSNPQGTPAGTIITFAGDQLVIGNGGTLQSMANGNNTAKIENLFMLGGSKFYWSNSKNNLLGNAHIRRADQKPVTFSANASIIQSFGMDVDGDENQNITFTTVKNDSACNDAVYTINASSDWSNYHGSILITNDCSVTNLTRVRFDATELPAHVTVAPNCEFKTYGNSINLAGLTERTETRVYIDDKSTWTVGDFAVDANVTLQFKDTTARFVVTNSLTIRSGSLTLKLNDGGFDMTNGEVAPIGLLSFGPNVDLTGVTTDTFIYEGFVKSGMPTVTFALERDEETGMTTLVARRKKIVIRESKYETTNPLSSHFWHAEKNASNEFCWTDHQAPHDGADYYLTAGATPPGTGKATDGFTFAGDSLIIKGTAKGVGFVNANGNTSTTAFWDFKDLRIIGDANTYVWFRTYNGNQPSRSFGGTSLSTWELRGKVTIAEGTSLHHSPYNSRMHYVTGEHFGSGSIELSSYQGTAAVGGNTGRIMLNALNTNYTGRIYFNHPYYEKKEKESGVVQYTIPDETVHVWLYMNDGRNLGGPIPAFSYNALSVNDWGRLVALDEKSNDLVLDQANRGIWVGWVGQFDVPKATTTLTIRNPITLSGNLYKRGAGTLALASPLRFAENNNVDEIGTPRANSNLVTVTEGSVKVTHPNALNGAAVTFAEGTKLIIPVSADATTELARFGAINTKGNGGFGSTATDSKIPVAFELPVEQPLTMTAAICTVKSESALSPNSFTITRPRGYSVTVEAVTDDAAQTKTFKATFERKGVILHIK